MPGLPTGLLCHTCFLDVHVSHPLHRVERFDGVSFEKTTLQQLGMVIQLGHAPGNICSSPAISPTSTVIIHMDGIHPITITFCNCNQMHVAGDRIQQALCVELYPATLVDPATFCTFHVLEVFHVLMLQSKINAYDFYLSMEKITNNSRLAKHSVSLLLLLHTTAYVSIVGTA